ncbi:hypothetical protein OAK52_03565 [Chloroflexi bacterium]|nr:hypothetical protein [Chloroflexota bacterium]
MKKHNNNDRSEKLRKMVPISEEEIINLNKLLEGVDNAIELMSNLVQPFDKEIDVSKMSSSVDGENYD